MVKNNPEYILFPDFSSKKMVCGTTIKGMNFALHTIYNQTDKEWVSNNRKDLLENLGYQNLITLNQIHSSRVHLITENNLNRFLNNSFIEGDGILTSLKGIIIGILSADCVPVFYTNAKNSFCGIVHAGWKGICQKIHLEMLAKIITEHLCSNDELQIIIGPHIRKCCYEIKRDLLLKMDTKFFIMTNNKIYLDLESIIINELILNGIDKNNIIKTKVCTKCNKNPEFYSYRNGDFTGRNLSFIGIKN